MPGTDFVTMRVHGDDDILLTLQRLGFELGERLLTKAMRAGGNVIVREARANLKAQRIGKTGSLGRALGVRVVAYTHSATTVAIIGVRRGSRYNNRSRLMHLIEFGHEKWIFGHRTDEMVKGYPFLTPAWTAKRGEAMRVTLDVLGRDVRKAAAKMGVKFGL